MIVHDAHTGVSRSTATPISVAWLWGTSVRGVACALPYRRTPHPFTCGCARLLLQGAFGRVDLVLVRPPGGVPFYAARKRMEVNADNQCAFEAEVEGLREGAGCPHIVQLYDARATDTYFELLLELMEGGTVAEELVGAGGLGSSSAVARTAFAWCEEALSKAIVSCTGPF